MVGGVKNTPYLATHWEKRIMGHVPTEHRRPILRWECGIAKHRQAGDQSDRPDGAIVFRLDRAAIVKKINVGKNY